MTCHVLRVCTLLLIQPIASPAAASDNSAVNAVGMKMVRIEPGCFRMGSDDGEFDERPAHKVTLRRPFWMAATEVTNAQYEQYAPEHKRLRGQRELSKDDEEAVIFVSWHEAVAFCEWLSKKEGRPYRLPTEAEWEYACRAGTTGAYHTGEKLPEAFHKQQLFAWNPVPVALHVGRTPANAWGLHDVHGNVEEWCHDTYGPYAAGEQTDPVGRAQGDMKVTRGGSHNTDVAYLRSANRLGTLPDDKHWLIGFRVVQGERPSTAPLPPPEPPLWARDVRQAKHDWSGGPDSKQPYFAGPEPFVHIPADSQGPLFSHHNHCPSITACENGDLLAVWFSTNSERGRELTIAASRRRLGSDRWDQAAPFFKAPDRNMTGSALFHDGQGKLYHFNGLEAGGGWANLALVLRTSTDNGVTWQTRLIDPHHQPRNQVISGTLRTREGCLVQACDAVHGANGGTAIHVSRDGGQTWFDPGADTPKPDFQGPAPGGTIAGIHAGVVQLSDGRLLAFGRGDNRQGTSNHVGPRMPQSVSNDLGKTWTYGASPFPPIDGGQRLVLMRLREGPLFFASFAKRIMIRDASGAERAISGLYAALSFDEGHAWSVRRAISDDGPGRSVEGTDGVAFSMGIDSAEPRGYLAACQTPDGVIHLLSSRNHYAFNLAWLAAAPPAARTGVGEDARTNRLPLHAVRPSVVRAEWASVAEPLLLLPDGR